MRFQRSKNLFIFSFIFISLMGNSCRQIASFIDVEVGEVPQKVEDTFVENPEGIEVTVWQEFLEIPWSLVFLPNGDALVTERPGRIRLIHNDTLSIEPYATLEFVMHNRGDEAGVMGLALHPDFSNQPFVYVMYTHVENDQKDNRVIRLRHDGIKGVFDKIIIKDIPAAVGNNGGSIKFGPDGMLYITTGDANEREIAQDIVIPGGKILRIDPEGRIPVDNPIYNSPVYTLGHRDPKGLAWHPDSGDLFASEQGPSGEIGTWGKDMINIIKFGKNYGWPRVVGAVHQEEYKDPIIVWENAILPSGIAFWDNSLFVATLRGESLARISLNRINDDYEVTAIEHWFASSWHNGRYGRLRDVVVGPDDALYVLTSNRDGQGDPKINDDRILRISKK